MQVSWRRKSVTTAGCNCPANEELIFDRSLDDKYERALALMGINAAMLSPHAGMPEPFRVLVERNIISDVSLSPHRQPRWCRMRRRSTWVSMSDKVSGKANEAAGKAKQVVGKATKSKTMRAEGTAQEAKGKAQVAVGKAKDKAKGAVDRM